MLAWTSLLLAFGAVQGVIYLKAYWGRFGLNPFQYADVDSLALVGLTGIGVTLALVGLGALFGGYIGSKMTAWTERARLLRWLVPVLLAAFVLALAFLVDFGIYLVIGILMTWIIIWLAHHSPDVPTLIKQATPLPYIVLALTYVPLGSYYFGQRQAAKVAASSTRALVTPTPFPDGGDGDLRLAGRLGDSYVFYGPKNGSVLVVPSAQVGALTLRDDGKGDGGK